jgi:hypothetical protein
MGVSVLDQYYIITDSYLLQPYQPPAPRRIAWCLAAKQVQIRGGQGSVCSRGYCLNHASGGHLPSDEDSEGLDLDRDRGRDLHFNTTFLIPALFAASLLQPITYVPTYLTQHAFARIELGTLPPLGRSVPVGPLSCLREGSQRHYLDDLSRIYFRGLTSQLLTAPPPSGRIQATDD